MFDPQVSMSADVTSTDFTEGWIPLCFEGLTFIFDCICFLFDTML